MTDLAPSVASAGTSVRWFKNGDHPDDHVGDHWPDPMTGGTYTKIEGVVVQFYRHPHVPGEQVHETCGRTMHDHGWIDQGDDGITVCPGDIVTTLPDGQYAVTRSADYVVVDQNKLGELFGKWGLPPWPDTADPDGRWTRGSELECSGIASAIAADMATLVASTPTAVTAGMDQATAALAAISDLEALIHPSTGPALYVHNEALSDELIEIVGRLRQAFGPPPRPPAPSVVEDRVIDLEDN